MDQQYTSQPLLDLEIDPTVSRAFREATRWAKFIAIIWSIFLGLVLLSAIFAGSAMSESFSSILENAQSPFASIFGSFLLLILGLVIVVGTVLLFFLFKFSSQLKEGLENQDQILFNNGLRALRNYFMIYGIFALIYFAMAVVSIIFTLIYLNS